LQKNNRLFVICLLVFSGIGVIFGFPNPVQTQNGGHEHLVMIDYLLPASNRLAVQGSIAVLAAGPDLLVYAVSDPDLPAQPAERVFSYKVIDVQVGYCCYNGALHTRHAWICRGY
jgi:hypothetical protein